MLRGGREGQREGGTGSSRRTWRTHACLLRWCIALTGLMLHMEGKWRIQGAAQEDTDCGVWALRSKHVRSMHCGQDSSAQRR
jgi:hypothetical protein